MSSIEEVRADIADVRRCVHKLRVGPARMSAIGLLAAYDEAVAEVDRLTAENEELERRINRAGDSLDSLSLDLEEALAERDAAEARAARAEQAIQRVEKLCDEAEANPEGWGGAMVISFARSLRAAACGDA